MALDYWINIVISQHVHTIHQHSKENKDQTVAPKVLSKPVQPPGAKCCNENAKQSATKHCQERNHVTTRHQAAQTCTSSLQGQGGAPLSLEDVDATVEDCPHEPVAAAK